jgi:hypothetical protein
LTSFIELEALESVMLRYSGVFENFIKEVSVKQKVTMLNINLNNFEQDEAISALLPDAFNHEYTAIKTPADGDCLWSMLSICMFGDLKYTRLLRFITIFVMIKEKTRFKSCCKSSIIHEYQLTNNGQIAGLVETKYKDLVLTARNRTSWGNEFHIYAMAIAFNSKVYIYHSFKDYLLKKKLTQEELIQAQSVAGGHLLYTPLATDCNRFICGYFRSQHYTAILPLDINSFELAPKNNLFRF